MNVSKQEFGYKRVLNAIFTIANFFTSQVPQNNLDVIRKKFIILTNYYKKVLPASKHQFCLFVSIKIGLVDLDHR